MKKWNTFEKKNVSFAKYANIDSENKQLDKLAKPTFRAEILRECFEADTEEVSKKHET